MKEIKKEVNKKSEELNKKKLSDKSIDKVSGGYHEDDYEPCYNKGNFGWCCFCCAYPNCPHFNKY